MKPQGFCSLLEWPEKAKPASAQVQPRASPQPVVSALLRRTAAGVGDRAHVVEHYERARGQCRSDTTWHRLSNGGKKSPVAMGCLTSELQRPPKTYVIGIRMKRTGFARQRPAVINEAHRFPRS